MKYSIEREAVADGDSRLWAIKRRAVYGCLLYWTAIFLLVVTIVYSSVARNLIRKSVVVDVDSLLYAFVVIGVALSIVYYLSMRKTLNKAFAERLEVARHHCAVACKTRQVVQGKRGALL